MKKFKYKFAKNWCIDDAWMTLEAFNTNKVRVRREKITPLSLEEL